MNPHTHLLTLSLKVASPALVSRCYTTSEKWSRLPALDFCPRFRYEENTGFPTGKNNYLPKFASIFHCFSLLSLTVDLPKRAIDKQTETGIDDVPEWAREPHLRDILKREYEEAQKRPRDVALEKRDPCLKE